MLFFKKLKHRGMYAISQGEYAGGFFVYIKEEDRGNSHALLMMPDTKSLYASHSEIKDDLRYNNIKFVKRLPLPVYEVIKANFKYYAEKEGIYANR